ncbi:hypothetical protein ACFOYW_09080 [Gryllotalpicola reticulitermitis]|uniref:Uncharacterized protein n=1 Tax=Gryllotalpicola reticulitermitis TaxID=1184153 RepID=A0ABV8Q691_9MICO
MEKGREVLGLENERSAASARTLAAACSAATHLADVRSAPEENQLRVISDPGVFAAYEGQVADQLPSTHSRELEGAMVLRTSPRVQAVTLDEVGEI